MAIDWNIASTWDDMYSVKRKIGHNRGEKIGYGREAMKQAYKADSDALDMHKERVQLIVKTLGLRSGASILVLGCGLPFLVETLRDVDAGIDRPYIPPYYRRNNITWWSLSEWAKQFSSQHRIVDLISQEPIVGTA
jgi:hypothetical protein